MLGLGFIPGCCRWSRTAKFEGDWEWWCWAFTAISIHKYCPGDLYSLKFPVRFVDGDENSKTGIRYPKGTQKLNGGWVSGYGGGRDLVSFSPPPLLVSRSIVDCLARDCAGQLVMVVAGIVVNLGLATLTIR